MADAKDTPMVIAAARELCRQHAKACEVNDQDTWNLYADDFTRDAQRVLEAAGAPLLLNALEYMTEVCPAIDGAGEEAHERARAAIAKVTRSTTP